MVRWMLRTHSLYDGPHERGPPRYTSHMFGVKHQATLITGSSPYSCLSSCPVPVLVAFWLCSRRCYGDPFAESCHAEAHRPAPRDGLGDPARGVHVQHLSWCSAAALGTDPRCHVALGFAWGHEHRPCPRACHCTSGPHQAAGWRRRARGPPAAAGLIQWRGHL
jgi:hypothetical protein